MTVCNPSLMLQMTCKYGFSLLFSTFSIMFIFSSSLNNRYITAAFLSIHMNQSFEWQPISQGWFPYDRRSQNVLRS